MAGNENSDANEPERTEAKQPSTKPSIVGIGAFAGGVQALQTFFEALPDRTGVAFVVIVHLAPESHSELPRILATRTRMPVAQVNEPAPLEPDHVYVIPPIGTCEFPITPLLRPTSGLSLEPGADDGGGA